MQVGSGVPFRSFHSGRTWNGLASVCAPVNLDQSIYASFVAPGDCKYQPPCLLPDLLSNVKISTDSLRLHRPCQISIAFGSALLQFSSHHQITLQTQSSRCSSNPPSALLCSQVPASLLRKTALSTSTQQSSPSPSEVSLYPPFPPYGCGICGIRDTSNES